VKQFPAIDQHPWTEPAETFAEFCKRPYCVWLDTATAPPGYSILAASPSKIFRCKGRAIEIIAPGGTIRFEADPFGALNEQLAEHRHPAAAGQQKFPLGAAIGYFGYDLKNVIEKLPATAVDDIGLPDCWFGFYDDLLVFDHTQQKIWCSGRHRGDIARAANVTNKCNDRYKIDDNCRGAESNVSRDRYVHAVLRAKDYIAAGDIYQVNLSQRFQCLIEASAADLYLTLRETNPAPYCAYVDIGDAQVLSSSPECFLNIHDRHVVTRPIKGTRPRDVDPSELLASPKDNAELLMITDLERNDLGKVCQFGSVWVRELRRVESYATVHHLVSTIDGLLRREVSHVDCVRACFPGGSITGAPKIRAMQIIDELESHARGVYTGAIGYLGFNGVSQFNIAIRTVVHQGGRLSFHAGGGIVADSDPDAEYEETLAKARGIFNAIDQLRIRQRPVCA
jgi:para-aminobenzoate synthetase component 1